MSLSRRVVAGSLLALCAVGASTPPLYHYSSWHYARWHHRHRHPQPYASYAARSAAHWSAPAVTGLTMADADALRPGQYLWRGGAPGVRSARVIVDLDRHRAYVYQGGALIGVSTISAGRPGHGTPSGTFPILEKSVHHRSNIYSNAPMPFMQRLTWGGIALHAGSFSGGNQSHGCIRLPWNFARLLFGVTALGGEVDVVRSQGLEAPVLVARAALPSTSEAVAQMAAAYL